MDLKRIPSTSSQSTSTMISATSARTSEASTTLNISRKLQELNTSPPTRMVTSRSPSRTSTSQSPPAIQSSIALASSRRLSRSPRSTTGRGERRIARNSLSAPLLLGSHLTGLMPSMATNEHHYNAEGSKQRSNSMQVVSEVYSGIIS